MDKPIFYKTSEVGKMLNLDRRTIFKAIKAGHLNTIMINNKYLVSQKQINEYVKKSILYTKI